MRGRRSLHRCEVRRAWTEKAEARVLTLAYGGSLSLSLPYSVPRGRNRSPSCHPRVRHMDSTTQTCVQNPDAEPGVGACTGCTQEKRCLYDGNLPFDRVSPICQLPNGKAVL